MRFARCECLDCHNGEFLITFEKDIPPLSLSCPVCGSKRVKYTWIDRAGFNNEYQSKT